MKAKAALHATLETSISLVLFSVTEWKPKGLAPYHPVGDDV